MSDRSQIIDLPAKIHAFLVDRIEGRWVGEGSDVQAVIEAFPRSLAAGQVQRLVSGGPFGWMIDARLDEIDGRIALEVLEDNRMSGPDHYRVWDDGTRDQLDTEQTGMVLPPNSSPEETQRIEDAYYAHNRAVQKGLEERGFLRSHGDARS
jgi:hypothetical protein